MFKEILKPVLIIFSFFVFLFAYSKIGPNLPISILNQQKGEPFVVSQEGSATGIPDMALISLGIEGTGPSLPALEKSINQKTKDLTSELTKLGVEDKDIKTTAYSVNPEYNYEVRPAKIAGYRINASYQVKIKDLDKVNDIIAKATDSGANLVGGITFQLSADKKEELLQTAREEATNKAKTKALGLTKAAGITLGKIINISESQGYEGRAVPVAAKLDSGLGSTEEVKAQIQPGETEVKVNVTISWEIR